MVFASPSQIPQTGARLHGHVAKGLKETADRESQPFKNIMPPRAERHYGRRREFIVSKYLKEIKRLEREVKSLNTFLRNCLKALGGSQEE